MATNTTFFKSDNRKKLSELYFKAVGDKEVLRKTISKNQYPNEQDLLEFTQLDKLVNQLRSILGTVVNTVP